MSTHTHDIRVCSEHFAQASDRLLTLDEVLSVRIPCSSKPKKSRKPPKYRRSISSNKTRASKDCSEEANDEIEDEVDVTQDSCVQTERIVSDEEKEENVIC